MIGIISRFVLTLAILAADAGIFYTLAQLEVPGANRDIVLALSGAMVSITTLSFNWWFSEGARRNLAEALKQTGTPKP